MTPVRLIALLAIPKSKAAVIDSPARTPDNGIGNEGIVLVTETPTDVICKGIVFNDKLVPLYACVFRYTYVI